MNIHKMEFAFGMIYGALTQAKQIALEKSVLVEFEFNRITCYVDAHTDNDCFMRDYNVGLKLSWKYIGPSYGELTNSALKT